MSNPNENNVETKELTTSNSEARGELTFDNDVIKKIIGQALENVSGLLAVDGGFFSNLTDKLINNPSVKINSRRNKCLINVKGESASSENIIQKSDQIRDGIKDGLVEFFGIDKAVKLKISVSDIQKKVTKKSTSRVK